MNAPRRMTPAETATYCGRSLTTVHRALAAGELHGAQRVKGGKWSIRPECADAWIDGDSCDCHNAAVIRFPTGRRTRAGAAS